mmetsp:Transcript_121098/g.386749  ORF Transcript_121098/g.386749 Transcript_121098/m.386749 type:complete len:767 (-) Transcript_121098:45-2345(-)
MDEADRDLAAPTLAAGEAPAPAPAATAAAVAPAAVGGGAAPPQAAGVARTDGDLVEAMRKRREGCVEFESAPGGALVTAPAVGPGSSAAVSGGYPYGGPSPIAASLWRAGSSAAGTSSGPGLSDSALAEVMRRRREACQEFESASAARPAAAAAAAAADAAAAVGGGSAGSKSGQGDGAEAAGVSVPAAAAAAGGGARKARTDSELQAWLLQLRGRCEVLESSPEQGSADTCWNKSAASSSGPGVWESTAAVGAADAKYQAGTRGSAPSVDAGRSKATGSADLGLQMDVEDLQRQALKDAQPLQDLVRSRLWSMRLRPEPGAKKEPVGDKREGHADVYSLASDLVSALIAGRCSDVAEGSAGAPEMARSFVDRHLHWLGFGAGTSCPSDGAMYSMLAQLLRYHYPAVASAVERDRIVAECTGAAAATGGEGGEGDSSPFVLVSEDGLAAALEAGLGSASGLAQMLLGAGETEESFKALRLLCDLVVLQEREGLLLFVAVEFLATGRKRLGKTALAQLREFGLSGRRAVDVRDCVQGAIALHEATPLSVLRLLSPGVRGPGSVLPFCTITPDEVLHHVYDHKSGLWRLVVVDVRRPTSGGAAAAAAAAGDEFDLASMALPVCLRFDASQDRRAVLKDLPYEESIHLCLIGDGPPMPGEEAFELCRFLATANGIRRPHVSVAEGGWEKVSTLAMALDLELMRIEHEDVEEKRSSVEVVVEKKARGLQKAAKKVFAGAGRALMQGFGGGSSGSGGGGGGQPPQNLPYAA